MPPFVTSDATSEREEMAWPDSELTRIGKLPPVKLLLEAVALIAPPLELEPSINSPWLALSIIWVRVIDRKIFGDPDGAIFTPLSPLSELIVSEILIRLLVLGLARIPSLVKLRI